mgnify:CR=1 FL=1
MTTLINQAFKDSADVPTMWRDMTVIRSFQTEFNSNYALRSQDENLNHIFFVHDDETDELKSAHIYRKHGSYALHNTTTHAMRRRKPYITYKSSQATNTQRMKLRRLLSWPNFVFDAHLIDPKRTLIDFCLATHKGNNKEALQAVCTLFDDGFYLFIKSRYSQENSYSVR